MKFLYELYLLVRAAPALADRYRNRWLIVIVSGAISIITKIAGSQWFKDNPEAKQILDQASQISAIITAVTAGWAFIALLMTRFPLDELVCREVKVDAHYYPPDVRAYDVIEISKCINRTDGPIREFSTFKDGYWTELDGWSASAQMIAAESHTNARIEMPAATTHEVRQLPGGGKTVHWYQRTAVFNPSLAPGDYCTVQCKMEARGDVETEAFAVAGTEYARGVNFNTLVYKIAIHAPAGYKILFQDARVLNADHEEDDSETKRQSKAKLNKDLTLLTWRVTLARKTLRYSLRYRFEPTA